MSYETSRSIIYKDLLNSFLHESKCCYLCLAINIPSNRTENLFISLTYLTFPPPNVIQVPDRIGEKRTLLNNIPRRKANWIGHILRRGRSLIT